MLRPALLAISLLAALAGARDRPPNLVVIFCDDLGYGDVLEHAEGYETPHVERLAADGMRFTSFYAAQPVCSASRAALLTGCYPNRVGIEGALGPSSNHGIHAAETTLAEVCKQRGYATAIYGKWHLGHRGPFLPTNHGFDEYIGIPYSNDMWPRHPDISPEQRARKEGYPDLPLIHNTTVIDHDITVEDQRQFTRYFTERAVRFIEEHAHEPFFLYLAHPMPHVPIYASERWAGRTERGLYGDVIGEIDWSVGEIAGALDRLGLANDTLVIFTSDNGPWLSYGNHAGSAGPLREGKGTTWEGGVRVPCVMRWPGTIPAGATCDEPAMTIDILPTLCEMLGLDLPERPIDGRSILALMRAEPGAATPHEALYFYYHDNNLEALRAGRWKLHLPHRYRTMRGSAPGADGMPGPYNHVDIVSPELYDLETDVGETTDLAAAHRDVVERLLVYAEAAREDMGDKLTGREGGNRREPGRWSPPPQPQASAAPDAEWWRDAVFYEVFVRSFADSIEGPLADDGVGDLRGLTERLDYLNEGDPATDADLGVTALWLMPICQSPSYHGYDVADYRRVDDEYGTNEDFLALVGAAHERGVRVIVDHVINHTSSQHPWFEESRERGSPKRDWYVWSRTRRPVEWESRRVWHRGTPRDDYYFGLFWMAMPDLNLRNAEATAAVHDLSRFWLDEMRADGFRLDAAKHLIEVWPRVENTDETIAWLADFRRAMKEARPDAFLVGEVWSSTEQIARYVPDSLDAAFEFPLAHAIVEGVRDGVAVRIARAIEEVRDAYPPGRYATFLANHDMQRVMTTLRDGADDDEALAKAKLAATIQFTLPGIPFIYYGEEIGMTGAKPDPDLRTPMQWNGDAGAGFTSGTPWHEPRADPGRTNVDAQRGDPDSLLSHYRRLIRMRRDHDAIAHGDVTILATDEPAVLAFERSGGGERAIVLANCSGRTLETLPRVGDDDGPLRIDAPGIEVLLGPAGGSLAPWTALVLVAEAG